MNQTALAAAREIRLAALIGPQRSTPQDKRRMAALREIERRRVEHEARI